jgi:glycosyltransferase involved in cell wall biosynthesis
MRTMPRVDRVVVLPGVDRAAFALAAGVPADRVVALDDFTTPRTSPLGTASAPVIFAPGRLGEGSGIPQLIEAFRLVSTQLGAWQLRITGWGPDLPAVQDAVERHGLGAHVRLLGQCRDLGGEYAAAGVVVRLAAPDANGLAVLEALSAGIPVLGVAQTPAVDRYVRDGVNGIVLDRSDPASIADGLLDLSDATTRARLAAGARSSPCGLLEASALASTAALFTDAAPADRRAS